VRVILADSAQAMGIGMLVPSFGVISVVLNDTICRKPRFQAKRPSGCQSRSFLGDVRFGRIQYTVTSVKDRCVQTVEPIRLEFRSQ